jgi:methylmalonyl-CoA mutase N-terminal domain/subunit
LIQREIQESAFRAQRAIDSGESPVVGVTRYQIGDSATIPTFGVNPENESVQIARLVRVREARDTPTWRASLDAIRDGARRDDANLVPLVIAAVRANATVGEISDTLREVFGEYRETIV